MVSACLCDLDGPAKSALGDQRPGNRAAEVGEVAGLPGIFGEPAAGLGKLDRAVEIKAVQFEEGQFVQASDIVGASDPLGCREAVGQ